MVTTGSGHSREALGGFELLYHPAHHPILGKTVQIWALRIASCFTNDGWRGTGQGKTAIICITSLCITRRRVPDREDRGEWFTTSEMWEELEGNEKPDSFLPVSCAP